MATVVAFLVCGCAIYFLPVSTSAPAVLAWAIAYRASDASTWLSLAALLTVVYFRRKSSQPRPVDKRWGKVTDDVLRRVTGRWSKVIKGARWQKAMKAAKRWSLMVKNLDSLRADDLDRFEEDDVVVFRVEKALLQGEVAKSGRNLSFLKVEDMDNPAEDAELYRRISELDENESEGEQE